MARWPGPGRCKRRLAQSVGPRRAAAVQTRLTGHVVATARQACGRTIELQLAGTGLSPGGLARWGACLGVDRIVDQGRGSLGLRLQRQVVLAGRQGIRQLILIGSDLPELDSQDLLAAFAALEGGAPLVLGPALDGGYWLLGLTLGGHRDVAAPQSTGNAAARRRWRTPAVRLFAGADQAIPWGSSQVREQTLRAASREGLAVTLLAPRNDLDRPPDLARWR